ncbi:MAG: transcriptional repressor [Clostridia bacterium]|nr:transcriptional repressor [Clostridia bacterium]
MSRGKEKLTPLMHRVLQTLSENQVHLTADEILNHLDDVGRATVYRALDRLCEQGIINRLSLEGGTSVYEYVREPHMHFICRQCGNLYDIHAEFSLPLEQIVAKCGHSVMKTDVTAYGICKNCLMAESN